MPLEKGTSAKINEAKGYSLRHAASSSSKPIEDTNRSHLNDYFATLEGEEAKVKGYSLRGKPSSSRQVSSAKEVSNPDKYYASLAAEKEDKEV